MPMRQILRAEVEVAALAAVHKGEKALVVSGAAGI